MIPLVLYYHQILRQPRPDHLWLRQALTIVQFRTAMTHVKEYWHPLHIDEHYAAGTQHGRRLVAGPLVISLVIGMSQADIGGRALDTLDYSNIRHLGPVFHGDTIYAASSVVMKEELPDQRGLVTVSTRGLNQREETILTLDRKIVVPKRPAGDRL